jgi:hypothetical protein
MLSLIVKGSKFAAAQAAADRGVPFVFVRELSHETVGYTSATMRDKVSAWFQEDLSRSAPYPVGALLHYQTQERA